MWYSADVVLYKNCSLYMLQGTFISGIWLLWSFYWRRNCNWCSRVVEQTPKTWWRKNCGCWDWMCSVASEGTFPRKESFLPTSHMAGWYFLIWAEGTGKWYKWQPIWQSFCCLVSYIVIPARHNFYTFYINLCLNVYFNLTDSSHQFRLPYKWVQSKPFLDCLNGCVHNT